MKRVKWRGMKQVANNGGKKVNADSLIHSQTYILLSHKNLSGTRPVGNFQSFHERVYI